MADEVVAHAFEGGFHSQRTERLAAYRGEAWGGPSAYSERYGTESDVVRIHSGNGPHEAMDRRALADQPRGRGPARAGLGGQWSGRDARKGPRPRGRRRRIAWLPPYSVLATSVYGTVELSPSPAAATSMK